MNLRYAWHVAVLRRVRFAQLREFERREGRTCYGVHGGGVGTME